MGCSSFGGAAVVRCDEGRRTKREVEASPTQLLEEEEQGEGVLGVSIYFSTFMILDSTSPSPRER